MALIEMAIGSFNVNNYYINNKIINPTGVRILRSKKTGLLKTITSKNKIIKSYSKNLKEIIFDYKPNDKVHNFISGNHRIGHFIVSADSLEELEYLIEIIDSLIKIEVV